MHFWCEGVGVCAGVCVCVGGGLVGVCDYRGVCMGWDVCVLVGGRVGVCVCVYFCWNVVEMFVCALEVGYL